MILPDLHLTRDAPLGCALILQHLLDEGIGLREAAERWPSYTIVKEKEHFPRERIEDAYAALSEGLPPAEPPPRTGFAWIGLPRGSGCTCGLQEPNRSFGSSRRREARLEPTGSSRRHETCSGSLKRVDPRKAAT